MPTLTSRVGGQIINPVRLARPNSGIRKSCTRTLSGSPWGRSSRPPFLKSPTNSFFLVSTEITGSLAPSAVDFAVQVFELSVAVGMVCSFLGLPVGLQAIAQLAQHPRHHAVAGRVPICCNSAASLRMLLQVQRSGDSGSPRVTGSTSRSRSRSRVGSFATAFLRPPQDAECVPAGGPPAR